MKLKDIVQNKHVLFITTKNIDYIRNTQELRLIEKYADGIEVVCSQQKSYILRILSVWNKMTWKIIDRNDVIFIGFAPQFIIPFLGYKLKEKIIVIDFFISVYDTLVWDRKKLHPAGFFASLCHWMDKCTLKNCNHVITDTKTHAEFFISEFNVDKEMIETIYIEADTKKFYPREQNKPNKLKDKFVVLYFGSILPLQGVEIVLDVIRALEGRKDIYFDIIGPIPNKYHKPIQDNVSYIEWLPQEKLAEHIANADMCLAGHFSAAIDKAKRTIPGKAFIYEAMEKKMVLGDCVANREIFTEDKTHFWVEQGNVNNLVEIIRKQAMENSAINR